MIGAADRLTILFSRRWAEGGYLRCPDNREGGFLGVGGKEEVPVLDGSILHLDLARAVPDPADIRLSRRRTDGHFPAADFTGCRPGGVISDPFPLFRR